MLASTALEKYFYNCDICSLNETKLYQDQGWYGIVVGIFHSLIEVYFLFVHCETRGMKW